MQKLIWQCKEGLADYPQEGRRFVFPDLQSEPCLCTRLSWVAPDAAVQRAMRHTSPETKRVYQLGLVHQVREHLEQADDKAYQGREALHLRDSASAKECTEKMEACK